MEKIINGLLEWLHDWHEEPISFLGAVAVVLVLAWSSWGRIESLFKKFPEQLQKRLQGLVPTALRWSPLILGALGVAFEAYFARWAGAAIFLLASLAILVERVARRRPGRSDSGWITAAELVLVALAVGGEHLLYLGLSRSEWALHHVYVILPTRSVSEHKPDERHRFWREYVSVHRQVFEGAPLVRIEPPLWRGGGADATGVEDLDKRLDPDAEARRLVPEVRRLLRRERFCPAIVVTSRISVDSGPTVRTVRAIHEFRLLRGEKAPVLDRAQLTIVPEGRAQLTSDDAPYFALRLAFAVIDVLPRLGCDPRPLLSDAERDAALARLLERYQSFLGLLPPGRVPEGLEQKVAQALTRQPVKTAEARALLDAYPRIAPGDKPPDLPPHVAAIATKLENL